MQIQHSKRWLVVSLSAVVLSGCSSMVQQAAPVEAARPASVAAGSTSKQASVAAAPAPVVESAVATPYKAGGSLVAKPSVMAGSGEKTHVVQPGENLFRISLNNGLKYKDVAAWNNLSDTNIKVGQVLRLTPPDAQSSTIIGNAPKATETVSTSNGSNTGVENSGVAANSKNYPKALKLPYSEDAGKALAQQSEGSTGKKIPATKGGIASAPAVQIDKKDSSSPAAISENKQKSEEKSQAPAGEDAVAWIWPTEGKVIRGYSDSNKGVDISGRTGQSVLAAGDGKVVYSGNGLRGYGKLIIIKHNKTFLSAYAHNSQLLVKEGQTVKKGQKIAEMGNTDADQVKLHFEIRRFGKPVDPMQYLDNKS